MSIGTGTRVREDALAVGCDDGTVRLWDNVIDIHGAGDESAKLASAFFAAPDMNAGQRGSGLVMEYQATNRSLICAGNSSSVRVWDVAAEQLSGQFLTGSDVCVTCLTSAYDNALGEVGAFGQDVIVGGFGDGELKVWDLRERAGGGPGGVLGTHGQWDGGRGGEDGGGGGGGYGRQFNDVQQMSFTEHSSWIVNTKFTR